ncbi:MAG: hypothetical protein OEM02_06625 [Desulfobulbaceae bacterium]|nr:hypothetical protein [Desulfobulbaceae bacterium]
MMAFIALIMVFGGLSLIVLNFNAVRTLPYYHKPVTLCDINLILQYRLLYYVGFALMDAIVFLLFESIAPGDVL